MDFIKERVQILYKKFNNCIDENGLPDITKIAFLLGFEIIEANNMIASYKGLLSRYNNDYQILINNNFSKESKRYSIAYLLSAYLLYYDFEKYNHENTLFRFNHLENNEDYNASYMAKLILIPEEVLQKNKLYQTNDIYYLSRYFNVPYKIMNEQISSHKVLKKGIN